MRHILFGILFGLLAVLPAFAAGTGAELTLKGDQIFLVKGGKSTALNQEMFPAQPIEDTNMRFLGVGQNDAKEQGIAPGLYLFEGDGKSVAFAATDAAEYCADVKFSPGKTVLAMDAGMSLVRDWLFFSYPAMKPIGDTVYYQTPDNPTLIWLGEEGVLVSTMDVDTHNRSCGYDPCGPVSVKQYDLETRKSTALMPGTDLCDYTLTGLDEMAGGLVTATELCLPSVKDWEVFPEGKPVKNVSLKLPE
jgi:hypothetical protein